jgi:hypothetical protein
MYAECDADDNEADIETDFFNAADIFEQRDASGRLVSEDDVPLLDAANRRRRQRAAETRYCAAVVNAQRINEAAAALAEQDADTGSDSDASYFGDADIGDALVAEHDDDVFHDNGDIVVCTPCSSAMSASATRFFLLTFCSFSF